jgi:hypothetical protein
MNILTDILSLIRRGVFVKQANPDDVFVIGVNEQPDMTGVASPIPYKSVKLIKVKDLKIAPAFCDNENTAYYPEAGVIGPFKEQIIDPVTNVCTNYFRSFASLSPNMIINESVDGDLIEFTTTGEPNTAANLGTGVGVYKDKVGETLRFKSIKAANTTINVVASPSNDEIRISLNQVLLTSPNGTIWQIVVNNSGTIQALAVG